MTPTNPSKKIICIVGGGPAGMLAAIELSKTHEVHLFEQGKTLGRKFLVAGKGGFNLSNQHKGFELREKYDPSSFFTPILEKFDTAKTRNFLKDLGIPTFVGSSGRVFPKLGIKPIAVLNAFKNRLIAQGVRFHFEHKFVDFTSEQIVFQTPKEKIVISFDDCIFALGGASWSVTGSKGDWRAIFESKGIRTKPFNPSNCGIHVQGFASQLIEDFEGSPLKNIAIRCGDTIVKGEAVLTPYGFEGNAIYPIAALLGK
jgi:predicted Rossmann fold flavoprotein